MVSYEYADGVTEPGKHSMDALMWAQSAIIFTSLATLAEQSKVAFPRLHLYSVAIELSLKSLALRAGATPSDCKNAGHKISKMVELVQARGATIPVRLLQHLDDDNWFSNMLGTRYPSIKETAPFHKDYRSMIAELLEVPGDVLLRFDDGSALSAIERTIERLRSGKAIG